MVGPDRIPIPALLATAAVHHHLIRKGLRTSVGLVVETGEAREVHHFALLAGYGAEAINPYLAFETLAEMADEFPAEVDGYEAVKRYIKSIDKGLLKVMSKMGISTYQSYCGAQIFDAIGLSKELVDAYFTGTATPIEGVGLKEIARGDGGAPPARLRRRAGLSHRRSTSAANTPSASAARRITGRPDTVALLQHAVRGNIEDKYARLRQAAQRPVRAAADHSRPVPHQGSRGGRAPAGSAR